MTKPTILSKNSIQLETKQLQISKGDYITITWQDGVKNCGTYQGLVNGFHLLMASGEIIPFKKSSIKHVQVKND